MFSNYQVLHISTSIWVLGAPNTGRNMLSGNKTYDQWSNVCTRTLVEDHSFAEFCNKFHAFSSFFQLYSTKFLEKAYFNQHSSAQHQNTGWIIQQPRQGVHFSKVKSTVMGIVSYQNDNILMLRVLEVKARLVWLVSSQLVDPEIGVQTSPRENSIFKTNWT